MAKRDCPNCNTCYLECQPTCPKCGLTEQTALRVAMRPNSAYWERIKKEIVDRTMYKMFGSFYDLWRLGRE
jgi:hypothetical protein